MSEEHPTEYVSLGGNDSTRALNVRFLPNGMVTFNQDNGEEVTLSKAIFDEIYIKMK